MKKVLVIANLFHASPRIPGFTAFLPEFGWQATIVTPPLGSESNLKFGFPKDFTSNVNLIEIPYRGDILWFWRKLFRKLGLRKRGSLTEQIKSTVGVSGQKSIIERLLYFYETIFGYPDVEKLWITPVIRRLAPIINHEKYDALISSSPYPTSHLIASRIKDEFHVPWLADFRDPWSLNHNYVYDPIRRWFDRRLEKKTLKNADSITAASPSYAMKEESIHNRKTMVITNGFDPETTTQKTTPLTQKFTVTYTGAIYPGKQDPVKLFKALKELIDSRKIDSQKMEVRIYGEKQSWLDKEIKKYGLENVVREYGPIPRGEATAKQRESQVLLLLCWEDPEETGVYPQKIFEYLAAQRPILAIGGSVKEDVKELIRETGSGLSALSVEDIKSALAGFYREFDKTGMVKYGGDSKIIENYSYRAMAKKFADILNIIAY